MKYTSQMIELRVTYNSFHGGYGESWRVKDRYRCIFVSEVMTYPIQTGRQFKAYGRCHQEKHLLVIDNTALSCFLELLQSSDEVTSPNCRSVRFSLVSNIIWATNYFEAILLLLILYVLTIADLVVIVIEPWSHRVTESYSVETQVLPACKWPISH